MSEQLIRLQKLMTKSRLSGVGGCKNCKHYFPETNFCAKELIIELDKKLGILVCSNWEKE